MNFKARFERKANAPEVTDADIVGVVTLNQEQFAWFSERLLDDYDFIADYAKETYDDGERKHCLLVLGEGEDDGILVCSEGSFYARYSAYLPKARQILRDEVHRVAELTIVELNRNTLTDEGKRDWSDVLAAKVERIYDGAYGTQIEVSGCPAHRLRDFSFALAGYCSEEQWSKWFNEPSENTEAPTMGGQA